MSEHPSQAQFIMEHFKKRPKQALAYDDWTDELSARYRELTGRRAYHVRSIARRLYAEGKLQKVKNGVYMYDPDYVPQPKAPRFTRAQKRAIQKRDGFRCVCCGMGKREGMTLYVDFLMPGIYEKTDDISYGSTYCSRHSPSKNGLTFKDMMTGALTQLNEVIKHRQGIEEPGLVDELAVIHDKYVSKF